MKIKIQFLIKPVTIWLFIFLILFNSEYAAQVHSSRNLPSGLSSKENYKLPDSIAENDSLKKNYWLPFLEITGANLAVFAYNKFFTHEGWSNISINSIKKNFTDGFAWDHDGFLINQFTHPYHGSAYFNSARTNGLSFWESAPYTLFGSLTWEYFMEIDNPSYNDIVNTPVSGIILGEISYRVSDLLLDESKVGFERFLRELSATVIDPIRGFNRLVRGDMWKDGRPGTPSKYSLTFSGGFHNVFFSRKFNDSRSYLAFRTELNYGDLFDVSGHTDPFDYFSLRTEINVAPGDNIVGIFASGVITDNNITLFEKSKNIIGIYKEIDININTVYKLSATSVTGQLINTATVSQSSNLRTYLGLSAILMGGTNSVYASEVEKDYNIGPGASAKAGIEWIIKDFGEIYSNYKRYWIHTLSGAEGEEN